MQGKVGGGGGSVAEEVRVVVPVGPVAERACDSFISGGGGGSGPVGGGGA